MTRDLIGQMTDLSARPVFADGARCHSGEQVAALISASGAVTELDTAAGARLVRGHEELVRHATAFLRTELVEAGFLWHLEQRTWLWATVRRHDRVVTGVERGLLRGVVGPAPHGLTNRELEVLTLIAAGLTNVEIGDVLVTSPRTASSQVERILRKLDQPTRAGAAAAAAEAGLLVLPFPGTGIMPRNSSGIAVETIAAAVRGELPTDRRGSPPQRSRPAPIRIGSVVPMHGTSIADATEMRNGSQLAIADANARGGVHGHRLEQLVVEADLTDPGAAKTAIQTLIAAEVDAITSGYFFGDSTILDGTVEYGAPYLHGQTAESYVEYVRRDPQRHGNIFQVCPSETNYGIGFLRFLDDLVYKEEWLPARRSVVLIETPVSGGLISTSETLDHAERASWSIDKVIQVSPVSANWNAVASEIRRLDPAGIMIASFLPEELAGFQQAFVAAPTNALVYAVYTPSIPAFRAHAGDTAEGLLWSTVSGTYGDAIGRRFFERYESAFGRSPGRGHAGIAYDEIQLLIRAWSEVDNIRDFKQVLARLRNNTHRGVNGSYSFDSDGQCGLSYPDAVLDPSLGQAHLVLQVRDGRDRVVSPAPYIEDHFVCPPWFA